MTTLSLLHHFKSQQQRFATTHPVLNHNADTVSVSNWCGKRTKDTLSLHYLFVDTLMMIPNAEWNSSTITDSGSSSVHNDTGLISALLSGWRVILSVPHRSGLEGRGYLQGGLTGVSTWKLRKKEKMRFFRKSYVFQISITSLKSTSNSNSNGCCHSPQLKMHHIFTEWVEYFNFSTHNINTIYILTLLDV